MQIKNTAEYIPIGVVVETLQRTYPQVTHSSLRFLEREGLVIPTRTAGGHRLYSPRDLDRIRQIKNWQAQRISLEEIRRRLHQRDQSTSPEHLCEQFLTAAVQGDLARASAVIRAADQVGTPIDQLFTEVLRPAMVEVGNRWAAGTLTVGQEKEISELARDLIAELAHNHAHPNPDGPVVVAACVAGERHELGIRMVVALLRTRGWRVHFLGADVDPQFLEERVQQWQPQMVLLSALQADRLADLATSIQAVSDTPGRPIVISGGQLVPGQVDAIRSMGAVPSPGNDLEVLLAIAHDHQSPANDPSEPRDR